MILKINDSKTIGDIKMKFAECFPYLKIEAYYRKHKWKAGTKAQFLVPAESKIGDIRRSHTQGIIDIKSWHKTGDVENIMRALFGLNIQVFRRYKDEWIQTTKSDNLTLREQSELAAETVGRVCVPE
jgi:hypothetical protein